MEARGRSLWWWITSALPPVIIACLLYAALFVKPSGAGTAVAEPIVSPRDRFYGVSIAGDGSMVAVGSDGKIVVGDFRHGPGAARRAASGTKETLQAVARWDERRLVAVGNDGVILVSDDGGATWMPVEAPKSKVANRLVKVKTAADGKAFAVGEFNTLLHTGDFGKSWERRLPEKDTVIYGIDIQGAHAAAVGEYGRVLISADGGETWKELQSPVKANLTAVAFGRDGAAVAVGLNGTAIFSADAGRTWSEVKTGSEEHLYDVVWTGQKYLAVGDRGAVLLSADGRIWSRVESGLGVAANYLWFMQALPAGDAYVLVGSGIAVMAASGKIRSSRL